MIPAICLMKIRKRILHIIGKSSGYKLLWHNNKRGRQNEGWRRNRGKGEEEKRIRKRRKIFGERKYSFAEEKKKT